MRRIGTALCALIVGGALVFGVVRASDGAGSTERNDGNWESYGGGLLGQHYSRLNAIDEHNVRELRGAWTFHTGVTGTFTSFESTPIVVGDTMYVTDPHSDVYALDATNGHMRWSYRPTYAALEKLPICCGDANRGVAVGDGRVYVAQLDAKLTALDARTGKSVWSVQVGDPKAGYSENAAPLFANGKLYIGVAGGEFEIRGYVTAYDAASGSQLWRRYTIPGPGETGHDSWPAGNLWQHGGGGVWTTPVLDPQSRTLYFVTGNPSPDLDGRIRRGDNLFTDCIVALNAETGAMRWAFQEVRHDVWDADPSSPPVLYDTMISGQPVHAVAQAGKLGWLYILDRDTGKPLEPMSSRPVPQDAWQHTAPEQTFVDRAPFVPQRCTSHLGQFPIAENPFVASSPGHPMEHCPGGNGGSEWSPVSYNPQTNALYVCGIDEPQVFGVHSELVSPGSERLGSIWTRVPSGRYAGTLTAIDARSGTTIWQNTTNMCLGGSLATAGGLVFFGNGNGKLEAFDAHRGHRLWAFQTGAGVNAPPIAYEVRGKEYIAVAAGGSWQLNFPRGDTLWVFSLDGTLAQARAPNLPPATLSSTHIMIRKTGFEPARLVVRPGTMITWTNDIATAQSVIARGGDWRSPLLPRRASYRHAFAREGAFDVTTAQTPALLGTIIVARDAPAQAGGQ